MLNVLMKQVCRDAAMLNALKNLYTNTNIIMDKIGEFRSTSGIRQGAASSVYIFICFVNGLFHHLRSIYCVNNILGAIHNLIHADDTIVLATDFSVFKRKIKSTVEFFNSINQTINLGKTKYMCIDSKNEQRKDDLVVDGVTIQYARKAKLNLIG